MAAMTDYLANAIRDHVLRNIIYVRPTTVYVAAFTTATTEAGGGTEVTGGSYARASISFNAGATPGLAQQGAIVTIAGMPACSVRAIAIMDALTVGNMLFHGRLPRQRNYTAGESFTLNSGDLRILID